MQKVFEPAVISLNQFPQNPTADETASRRLRDPSFSPSGVYRYYDRYQTRVSIGQQQHTLATGSLHACLRMTDAAMLYFWGYRKRPQRNPIDTDFNIGIESAQSDLDNCGWLRDHLEAIEHALIGMRLIDATNKRSVSTAPGAFDREKFLLFWKGFAQQAQLGIQQLRSTGEPAKVLHVSMVEALDTISKVIDTADRAVWKPASMSPRDASLDQAL